MGKDYIDVWTLREECSELWVNSDGSGECVPADVEDITDDVYDREGFYLAVPGSLEGYGIPRRPAPTSFWNALNDAEQLDFGRGTRLIAIPANATIHKELADCWRMEHRRYCDCKHGPAYEVLGDLRQWAQGMRRYRAAVDVLDCPAGRRWINNKDTWDVIGFQHEGQWRINWELAEGLALEGEFSTGENAIMLISLAIVLDRSITTSMFLSLDWHSKHAAIAGISTLCGLDSISCNPSGLV